MYFLNNNWSGVGPIYPDAALKGNGGLGFYEKIKPYSKQFFEELRGDGGIDIRVY